MTSPPAMVEHKVSLSPPAQVRAERGPLLLAHLDDGPGLAAHRVRTGPLPRHTVAELLGRLEAAGVRGRGGAGFPFSVKLQTAAQRGGRAEIVVNLAEGEPASAKDTALALYTPHQVLDGAAVVAAALGVKRIHIATPGERPLVGAAIRVALDERAAAGERLRWTVVETSGRFVAGQARAVLEALQGRPGLPVTAWAPEAISGLRGRPTLLSNAETWAHVAAIALGGTTRYAALGTSAEPGTTLLTLDLGAATEPDGSSAAVVVEVAYGTPWTEVLGARVQDAVLLGGFHGTWAAPGQLARHTVSRVELAEAGLALGAGVVIPTTACPVRVTGRVTTYLAAESAGRCGPCRNGLPALADEMARLAAADSSASYSRLAELAGLVTGRGACAHPDGTARLVGSLLRTVEDEVAAHLSGRCGWSER